MDTGDASLVLEGTSRILEDASLELGDTSLTLRDPSVTSAESRAEVDTDTDTDVGVEVDTGVEPWMARFPGLGSVLVAEDGSTTISCVDGAQVQERADALRWGWAEPLSWLRRGYDLTSAVVVDADGRAMVISGSHPETLIVIRALSERGWSILADSLTPVREEEAGFFARGRAAPVLVPEKLAEKWDLSGRPVRDDSDVVAVELPRALGPARVHGVLYVSHRQFGDSGEVEVISGAKRLQMSSSLFQRGPDEPSDTEASTIMARDLRVAQLPAARIRLDASEGALDPAEVLGWWRGIGPFDE